MKMKDGALRGLCLFSLFFKPAKSALGLTVIPHELYAGLTGCMITANPEIDCHSRHFRSPYIWTATSIYADLYKIDTWERSDSLFGLKLYFSSYMFLGNESSPVLGDVVGDTTVVQKSYTFSTFKSIKYIDQYGMDTASGFRFIYSDSTYVNVGPINFNDPVYRATITTQFAGLRCVFQKKGDADPTIMGVFGCNAY